MHGLFSSDFLPKLLTNKDLYLMLPPLGFLNGVKSICSIMTQKPFFPRSGDIRVYGSVISDTLNVIDVIQDSVM